MDKPFPAYKGDEPYVFVSYSHSNASAVYPELVSLKESGFNVWYDEGIEAGTKWREEIAQAIKKANLFLYFVTPESVRSENCNREVNFAVDEQIPMIAIHLMNTDLPDGLKLTMSDRQAILQYEIPAAEYEQKLQTRVAAYLDQAPATRPSENWEPFQETQITARSIAVLPFVNMSNDPDNEYFSDGISEEILNTLVKTNVLPVIARTSSFQFKGRNLSVQKIASELRVSHILEGSVRKVGNNVRITAQLIDAKTGVHLWADKYDRELVNIFMMQDEISAAIVAEIRSLVGAPASGAGIRMRTHIANPQAYDLYLHGLEKSRNPNGPGLIKAITLFEQAVQLDPEFTAAWVELASAHDLSLIAGEIPRQYFPKIEDALTHALNLEPKNALALSILGYARAHYDYQWAEGAAMMKRAVELGPQDSRVLAKYSLHLHVTGKPNAMPSADKAYQLDPLSHIAMLSYTWVLTDAGRQLDAQKVIDGFLGTVPPLSAAFHYLMRGELDLARQKIEESKVRFGLEDTETLISEYMWLKRNGDNRASRQIEEKLLQRKETEYVTYNTWGGGKSLRRRFELAYQQRDPHFIMSVLNARPWQFNEEEWQTLKQNMNFDQLGNVSWGSVSLQRTAAEIKALRANQVKVDPYDLESYSGIFNAKGFLPLHFSVKDGTLHLAFQGTQLRTIALDENRFELENLKGFSYTFVDAEDYDLIEIRGQTTMYYSKAEP